MSKLEDDLLFGIKAVGLPEPVRELHFDWCCEHPKANHYARYLGDPVYDFKSECSACAGERAYHEYAKGRGFRFDFAWPDHMLAVEVEGGTFNGGRHVRPIGFEKDAEKRNIAQIRGWRVLSFTRRQITSGEALTMIEAALRQEVKP